MPNPSKAKAELTEDGGLMESRPLSAVVEAVGGDERRQRLPYGVDPDDVPSASNPYQSYFDSFELQDFDACGFFRWQGFKSSDEAMATNEWLHTVLPWVGKLKREHASRLRHVFKATAARRTQFWEELRITEAQEKLRKTVKTSVLDMQEDMVVLTTEEFKRTTQEELADEPVFKTLNQETTWREGDIDYLDLFRAYQQSVTDEVFSSLAQDLIADLTPLSSKADSFSQFIYEHKGRDALKAARRGRETTRTVASEWSALAEISSRVFAPEVRSFDEVRKKLAVENQLHPMVVYMTTIVHSYHHYFHFEPTVPSFLNEREAFVDLTWSFIRGAFTMAQIQTRMLEVSLSGSKERKTQTRSRGERQEVARKADGVAFHEQHQIYIAESALIYGATQDKKDEDAWKAKRALRDSWVSQIKAISQSAHPRRGMSVFGSTSHNRETVFFALDYRGVFRVRTLASMTMPMQAASFAAGMQQCIWACLEFVLHVLEETERREQAPKITTQEEREDLVEAAAAIPTTSSTPKKGILKAQ
ncbi:hypothetical protein BGZ70_000094 [Mortierella alpina]|uniref:Uncharacterized protein n=1 Tax=Mortierella alpina TaxID=64518 RepID=A0A9P6IYI4_MORAP|nr:hypothetical protein BGZ70_000094 [Mortierella alpina]